MNSKKEKEKETKEDKPKKKEKKKSKQIITIPTFNINIQIDHFKTKFYILNTLPTYKYIHFKTTFMCPRSFAGVPFDSVRRFRAALLLHTTCMHLCSNWVADFVAA